MQRPRPSEEWLREYPEGKPSLAWTAADYAAWGMSPPDELSDEITEGELMGEEEVTDWIRDCTATIRVIGEENPVRAAELRKEFIADLYYLLSLAKVTEEIIDFALDEGNFKWYDEQHER